MDIDGLAQKIDNLKDDIDKRLDEITKRLDKFENQNISNLERITTNSEKLRGLQGELTEHKIDDKEYGKQFDERLAKIEAKQNKIWIYVVVIIMSMGSGAGILQMLSNLIK